LLLDGDLNLPRNKYCDSIIAIAEPLNNYNSLSLAYVRLGTMHFNINYDYKKALNNYLIALKYVKLTSNTDLVNSINYNIALLKDRFGEYQEALFIEKEIYKKKEELSNEFSLNLLSLLATTYRNLNALDSSSYYNKLGFKKSIETNSDKMYSFFLLNEAVGDFEKKQYQNAFDSIAKSIPLLKKTNNIPNLAIAYAYLGKIYELEGKEVKAISNFKRIDSIFNIINDLHPMARFTYESLINHYKKENNTTQQLVYIKQLLKLDSILSSNNIYIGKKIIKEYDIPKLEAEKNALSLQLKKNKNSSALNNWMYISLLIFILSGFYYQYKKRLLTKKRFEELLDEQNTTAALDNITIKKEKTSPIPKHIAHPILEQLELFEKEQRFTALGLTSQILAKNLDTNTHYLSNVINHYKEQSFANYLNNLRVAYAIERIKKDLVFRKYTIDAIANEVGFQNTGTFYKAFSKKTGITPSFFIKELNKKEGVGA